MVAVGRVGRPHGLDGSFYVTRPKSRMLSIGAVLGLDGRAATIVRRAGTEQRPIVRLEGVEDRPSAEALRGRELTVRADAVPARERANGGSTNSRDARSATVSGCSARSPG